MARLRDLDVTLVIDTTKWTEAMNRAAVALAEVEVAGARFARTIRPWWHRPVRPADWVRDPSPSASARLWRNL